MALKKSQLYSSIWAACDALRGGMDASQYKDYVLVLLFVRYVSDKYANQKNSVVKVPPGGTFDDLKALKGKKEIGEGINLALGKLAEANELRGVIDAVDFNDDNKLGRGDDMTDRLTKLIAIFENPDLDFSTNRAEGDDLLGDAYEYLMRHFAVESGKSKGQFYTPAEVSRVIAKVIGAEHAQGELQTVYDPTCGSGSLLLKVAAEAPRGITIYGQELDTATAGMAILNMWLHDKTTATIVKGDSTLSRPQFLEKGALQTFDYVVANPPFSYKSWRNGFDPEHDQFGRFDGFGIPPNKNGDFAFLLHIVKSLKSTGSGAVVLPHGVLFRGNAEAQIRESLIKRGYIKGIIGLPANLFYGTGIPACIIVLDKKDAASRTGIFMIDASKGFLKDGNKNRLREQDIRKIVDVWHGQLELPRFSRFVPNEEIAGRNEYNLNLPRYIDTQEPEDIQDIDAHLNGGLPNADIDALSAYWDVCPTLRQTLFADGDRPGYSRLLIPTDKVRSAILSHAEFTKFRELVRGRFRAWAKESDSLLRGISTKDHPKAIIAKINGRMLEHFSDLSLIDKYDIYQLLMSYWEETMQDDAYFLTTDGWEKGNQVVRLQRTGKGAAKDVAGLEGLEGRLIPVSLIIQVYCAEEQSQLDELQSRLEQLQTQKEELQDEHGGEEGLMESVTEDEKISKPALLARLKEIKGDKEAGDERAVLEQYVQLLDDELETKRKIKESERLLEEKVLAAYGKLSASDVVSLVVDQKWFATLEQRICEHADRQAQKLASRVKELAERYENTLPQLTSSVNSLETKVESHMRWMGYAW